MIPAPQDHDTNTYQRCFTLAIWYVAISPRSRTASPNTAIGTHAPKKVFWIFHQHPKHLLIYGAVFISPYVEHKNILSVLQKAESQ